MLIGEIHSPLLYLLSYARFERTGSPGVAITSFTQAEIEQGSIHFIHDGSAHNPVFVIRVSDGTYESSLLLASVIVNFRPTISLNTLEVGEGETITISSDIISAQNPNQGDTLTFTVSDITYARFERTGSPGVAITSFTQAEIEQGSIHFIHDGSVHNPSFTIMVSDGTYESSALLASVIVNFRPTISLNTLEVGQGETITISSDIISAQDTNQGDTLTFTVSSITYARFERTGSPGTAITSFTQAEIEQGSIHFIHDGSAHNPSFTIMVSDGTYTSNLLLVNVIVNSIPTIDFHPFEVGQGEAITIGPDIIIARDVDQEDTLTFTVSDVRYARFERAGSPGVAITSFTQTEFEQGSIRFTHDGSTRKPGFTIKVSDGINESEGLVIGVGVNFRPTISLNTLEVDQGETITISSDIISAQDANRGDTLTFTVFAIGYARFERTGSPGVAITSFTQAEIEQGSIHFIHDGSAHNPVFVIRVSDGTYESSLLLASVIVNFRPTISLNTLEVGEGETITISSDIISAQNPNQGDTLTFTVSDITYARFERTGSPGVAITSFTQAEIEQGSIHFIHDGSVHNPSFTIMVSDGTYESNALLASVIVNFRPTISLNTFEIGEGKTIIISPDIISAQDANQGDTLTFEVASVGSIFERAGSPGTVLISFTQAEIEQGSIYFKHLIRTSYDTFFFIRVSDGTYTSDLLLVNVIVNSIPTIDFHPFEVGQGEAITIGPDIIIAQDVDQEDTLTFTVSDVRYARFERAGSPGVAITSFTQTEFEQGSIRFTHDGSTRRPGFTIKVSDGINESEGLIIGVGVNFRPTISLNTLEVGQGETITIGPDTISAQDANQGDTLTFTVFAIGYARFERSGSPGVAITSFTQAEIEQGSIHFIHDGSVHNPSFTIMVSDGTYESDALLASVIVNFRPTISLNTLEIGEGETITIGSDIISAQDTNQGDTLTFTVSNITYARFERTGSPGVAITSFTQAEIEQGDIHFIHDGSVHNPSFTIMVSDGTYESNALLASVIVNFRPTISLNTLEIGEGKTIIISPDIISAQDANQGDTLTFEIAAVGSVFERAGSPGTFISRFTQAEIEQGSIYFKHLSRSSYDPFFFIRVSDGTYTSDLLLVNVIVNSIPTIDFHPFEVGQGEAITIGPDIIIAQDVDQEDTLTFTVSDVRYARFERAGSPGVAITSFTQTEFEQGSIRFTHDGSTRKPGFTIKVSDGINESEGLVIGVIVNFRPTISLNTLEVGQGETITISSDIIIAQDANRGDTLTFTVSGITYARFERTGSPGVAITSFTQAEIEQGDIHFIHDGSAHNPSFTIMVSDGTYESDALLASVIVNFRPTISLNTLEVGEGETITISSDIISAQNPNQGDTLTFTVSDITYARFERTGSPGVAITSFTQAEIEQGSIHFIHDGSVHNPSFTIMVSDGTYESNALLASVIVNFRPTISLNTFEIGEGKTIIISPDIISAQDANQGDTLTFEVASVGSIFERAGSPGTVLISFTQAEIEQGSIYFKHLIRTSYDTFFFIRVSDGTYTSDLLLVNVIVNSIPTIDFHPFEVGQGEAITIGPDIIIAQDVDQEDTLTFTVSDVRYARFERAGSPGVAITSFTQTEFEQGSIRFTHDGSTRRPGFTIKVSDGINESEGLIIGVRVNFRPIISLNTLEVGQGETITISSDIISAQDANRGDTLTFTVFAIGYARFERAGSPGVAITSFTQAEIEQGSIHFIHDGSAHNPVFVIRVSDGTYESSLLLASVIVNFRPTISLNTLEVGEGETITISSDIISAQDTNQGDTLTFTVSSITYARFERSGSPGVAITSFTQAEIEQGSIHFIHDGSVHNPSFTIMVSDGTYESDALLASVIVNFRPTISLNTLEVGQGETITISSDIIIAQDANRGDTLTFTVSGITYARFERTGSPGVAITSFTQAEIEQGDIHFIHDGSVHNPSFTIMVSDGTYESDALLASVIVNFRPTISLNTLEVGEGETITISPDIISAQDTNQEDTLTFTVSGITYARFERAGSPGVAITSFTQAEIEQGSIHFIHDGSAHNPVFVIRVSDGTYESSLLLASVIVNFRPTISLNTLEVGEGETITISSDIISAQDTNQGDTLTFTVSSITYARFERSGSPGVAITSFTQAEIEQGSIHFIHDGSVHNPSFTIMVSDGTYESDALLANVIVNFRPTISLNTLEVGQGETITISSDIIIAQDANRGDTLTFTVSGITYARFERTGSPGVAITSFTQAEIEQGDIHFIHDGSAHNPSFTIMVSDGTYESDALLASVIVNFRPTISLNTLEVGEGETITISSDIISAQNPNQGDTLTFTVSDITYARFERTGSPGVAITSFTQAEIEQGSIHFIHDGSVHNPSFTIMVSDGTYESNALLASVIVNFRPTISLNTFEIGEGKTIIISPDIISAQDANQGDTLTFEVASVGSIFERAGSPGTVLISFTQAEIEQGSIYFKHLIRTSYDTFFFIRVSDGTYTSDLLLVNVIVNSIPTIDFHPFEVGQGEAITIGPDIIIAQDVDQEDTLTFTVSDVRYARFERAGSPGVAITSFTQTEFEQGSIRFTHDGSTRRPGFTIKVSDGINESEGLIIGVRVNFRPIISLNTLEVGQGETITISSDIISAQDANRGDTLTFTVFAIGYARFERSGSPGVAITSFTQAEIEQGSIHFIHDGSVHNPSFTIMVSDGTYESDALLASVIVNFRPTISLNTLEVGEGETITVSSDIISAQDTNQGDTLTFTVSNITYARFERAGSPGVAITSFTQAEIEQGSIHFIHDGSVHNPSFTIMVSDGTYESDALLANVIVKFRPTISLNTLEVGEGETITVSSDIISAQDTNQGDTLTFTVSNITYARFERAGSPGVAITSFTQAEIEQGSIHFIHDGSVHNPSFTIMVSDGTYESDALLANVIVKFRPTISLNTLEVGEGETITVSSDIISAQDTNQGDTLTFTVSNITYARFERAGSPGVAITSFTQAEIEQGSIHFIHDGSVHNPSFTIMVSDGTYESDALLANVIVNFRPTISLNTLEVGEGETITVSSDIISAQDTNQGDTLTFTVSNITYARFERAGSPGVAITSFTQAEIEQGSIHFIHDGSVHNPSFTIMVSDGTYESDALLANVIVKFRPTISLNTLEVGEGETITISPDIISAQDTNQGDTLTFTVSNITYARFERTGSPGVAITSFTQAEIEQGSIHFIHDGSAHNPSFTIMVSDGTYESNALLASVIVNFRPTISLNTLEIDQGETITISSDIISAQDTNQGDTLTFTVSGITYARFERTGSPGVAITSFTQAEIEQGSIHFIHDGSVHNPSFTIMVSDGTYEGSVFSADIVFNLVVPQTGLIAHFDAQNIDGDGDLSNQPVDGNLVEIWVSSSSLESALRAITPFERVRPTYVDDGINGHGVLQFDGVDDSLHINNYININGPYSQKSFAMLIKTGSDIDSLQVIYEQGDNTKGYNIVISDGHLYVGVWNRDWDVGHTHKFIDLGVVRANAVYNIITVQDSSTSSDVSNIFKAYLNGAFVGEVDHVDAQTAHTASTIGSSGITVNPVNYESVNYADGYFNGYIGELLSYNHALSEDEISDLTDYMIYKWDINIETAIKTATLELHKGQVITVTTDMIDAVYFNHLASEIIFGVANVAHGFFALHDNPSVAVTTFTLQDIEDGNVKFTHDSSNDAPSFDIRISDGTTTTSFTPTVINFDVTVSYVYGNERHNVIIGTDGDDVLVGGSGDDVLTGGLGSDIFDYNNVNDGFDIITDFSLSEGDKLDLSDLLDYQAGDALSDFVRVGVDLYDKCVFVDIDADNDGNIDLVVILEGAGTSALTLSDFTDNLIVL